MNKRSSIALIALLFIVAISVATFAYMRTRNNSITSNDQQTIQQEEGQMISATGTLDCLKQGASNQPHTMECALGLMTKDNKSYGLSSEDPMLIGTIPTNSQIEVNGILKSNAAQNKYETDGTIWVKSVKRL